MAAPAYARAQSIDHSAAAPLTCGDVRLACRDASTCWSACGEAVGGAISFELEEDESFFFSWGKAHPPNAAPLLSHDATDRSHTSSTLRHTTHTRIQTPTALLLTFSPASSAVRATAHQALSPSPSLCRTRPAKPPSKHTETTAHRPPPNRNHGHRKCLCRSDGAISLVSRGPRRRRRRRRAARPVPSPPIAHPRAALAVPPPQQKNLHHQ